MTRTARVLVGDRDCSAAVITALSAAGIPTGGANTTRDIRSCFISTGVWQSKPVSFIASPGDLYLSEGHHVAMCKQQIPDELMEFSHNENWGYYNGQVGDQLNNQGANAESHVRSYYDYPWNCIMHYTGDRQKAADAVKIMEFMCNDSRFGYTMSIPGREGDPSLGYATIVLDGDEPGPAPVPPTPTPTSEVVVNAVANDGHKIIEATKTSEGHMIIQANHPLQYLSIYANPGVLESRAYDQQSKWLPILLNPSDISDHNKGSIGNGKSITGIQLNLLSPNSDMAIFYRVETEKGWYDWLQDVYEMNPDGTIKANGDNFAGDLINGIYGIEYYVAKATY